METKKLSRREWDRKMDRLDKTIARHAKSVIENMKMLAEAASDSNYEEAELRRKHANESFSEVQGVLKEMVALEKVEIEEEE